MAYSCGLPWMYFWHVNFCNFFKGERQWWYQVCTEVAYFQVAPAKGSIRSPGVNEKWASPTSQFLVKPSFIFQAHYETWVITNMYLFFFPVNIAHSHCSWSLESSNPISPNHVTIFSIKNYMWRLNFVMSFDAIEVGVTCTVSTLSAHICAIDLFVNGHLYNVADTILTYAQMFLETGHIPKLT